MVPQPASTAWKQYGALGSVNTYRAAATGADFFERKERGVANTGVF
jgi:hypothetical protein